MFTRAVTRLSRKRPPSEIHSNEALAPRAAQTRIQETWTRSLESLLEDPAGVAAFKEFLSKEFSEENLLFWLACEELKKNEDPDKLQEKADCIFQTFLANEAPSPVNLENQSQIGEQILQKPHPLMYQKQQEQIFRLMKYDSYSRFLQSLRPSHEGDIPEESAPKRASIIYNT